MTIPQTPTIIEVWAPWCAQCKAMRPWVDLIAAEHPGVDLVMLNTAERPEKAAALGVRGTPTLIGYSGGHEVFRATGRRTPSELQHLFESVASGSVAPPVGRVDGVLRLGVAVLLSVLGLASGPSWSLVVLGVAVGLFGYITMHRRAK